MSERTQRSRTPIVQHQTSKQTVVRRSVAKFASPEIVTTHLESEKIDDAVPKTSTPRESTVEHTSNIILRNQKEVAVDKKETPLPSSFNKVTSITKSTSVKKTTSHANARKSYSDYSSGYSDSEEVPKTDYTYAKSESYRSRVTPNRGTTHPNMSRPHLRNRQGFALGMFSDGSSDEEVSLKGSTLMSRFSQYYQHGSEQSNASQTSDKDTDKWETEVHSGGSHNRDLRTSLEGFEGIQMKCSYGLDNGYSDEDAEVIHKKTVQRKSVFIRMVSTVTETITRIIGWLWFSTWKVVYFAICYIMLMDTWTLKKFQGLRRWKKLFFILFLLVMLLLLLGYLFNKEDDHSYIAIKDLVLSLPSSLWTKTVSLKKSSVMMIESVYSRIQLQAVSSTISNWWIALWATLIGLFKSSSTKSFEVGEERSSAYHYKPVVNSDTTHMTEDQIKHLVHEVFRQEMSGWEAQQTIFSMDKVRQIQEHEENMQKLQFEMRQILQNSQHMVNEVTDMRNTILLQEERKDSIETNTRLSSLKNKLEEVEQKIHSVEDILVAMKNCCHNHSEYIATAEKHVASLLLEIMKGNYKDETSPFGMFGNWLKTTFVGRDEITAHIGIIADRVTSDVSDTLQQRAEVVAKAAAAAIVADSVKSSNIPFYGMSEDGSRLINATKKCASEEEVKKIVKNAIFLYDADKTGLVDYALESSGGSIVSTRCSETYNAGTAQITVFGIPVWSNANSPRTVIQPEVHPGQCWAFKGTQGYLVIKLSVTIHPTAFSMEHIPKALSVTGSIDSAPKDFSVWGLQAENDMEGKLLGAYRYNKNDDPIQYFQVQDPSPGPYQIIELRILSNHGHMDYTCLYRFRVHGRQV